MKECFKKFLVEYKKIYDNKDSVTYNKDHEISKFFYEVVAEKVKEALSLDYDVYEIKSSIAQGGWAYAPWIAIRDKRISPSTKKGAYFVYLFGQNGCVYLTFGQGVEDDNYSAERNKIVESLEQLPLAVKHNMDAFEYNEKVPMVLGTNPTLRAKKYQECALFYKKYSIENMPSDDLLKNDLNKMLGIYQAYVQVALGISENVGDDMNSDVKEYVRKIKEHICSKGFKYEDGIIENFYLSLKSKPFVLLAGTSGTGKTRLAKLFAEAIGATSENGRYKMVPVRPDWSDSSDLLGHIDLNGNFVPGAIYDFVKSAMDNKEKPYFLCLDEMNLARVEYYFSDFLSIIETRDMDSNGNISSEVLYSNKALSESEKLNLPENLYIIGTVNMDETTFPFSRKVLDRANTIEFSYVNLNVDTLESFGETNQLDLDNEFLKSKYLLLAHCKDELDYVRARADELQKINEILQKADAHIGYRVRDEIIFYLLNNKESKLIDENEAFDNELMQKILPRIQGSSEVIKNMLCNLFEGCFNEPSKVQTESDNTFELMYKQCEVENCKYKHSARKIAYMVRRFEEDGFTSYWL